MIPSLPRPILTQKPHYIKPSNDFVPAIERLTAEALVSLPPPSVFPSPLPGDALIGWQSPSPLSITQCKQGADWLLASPHWAAWKKQLLAPRFAGGPGLVGWKEISWGLFPAHTPNALPPFPEAEPTVPWAKRRSKSGEDQKEERKGETDWVPISDFESKAIHSSRFGASITGGMGGGVDWSAGTPPFTDSWSKDSRRCSHEGWGEKLEMSRC